MVTVKYGEILEAFRFTKLEKEHLGRDYARLQQASIGKTNELIVAGLPNFRTTTFLEHIDQLPLYPGLKALSKSEDTVEHVGFYCNKTGKFKKELMELIDSNMPPTVTNNDLFSLPCTHLRSLITTCILTGSRAL